MDVAVKGKKLDVGEALRSHVVTNLESAVTKYFSRAHDATVTVSREAHRFRVDISVHPVAGVLAQAHASAEDAYAAFDASLERIAKQIRRYKRRITNHHKGRAPEETIPAQQYVIAAESEEADELPEDAQPAIIAELPTEIATLSVSEAVMRMDLGDVPAMMFRNRANGGLNVVYRRPDGNIGWIDPSGTDKP
ncbi:MAG: ribosome-associated translation inhibitor RaiA [Rhodospirillales bacterium]|nr:MAG: ribosome-associated translation inhibitor RaiA [Rhodospirillales bacterium]